MDRTSSRPRRARAASSSGTTKQIPLLRASLAVSLDGFIADAAGGVAWLNPFFSPELDFAGFMKTIGAVVMGRKTFAESLKLGGAGGAGGTTIVLTHRPLKHAPQGVEGYAGDLRKLIGRLRGELAASGKDIWLMGGGLAIDAFRAAGLVDRLELGVIPVLLGQGIPLFPPQSRGHEGLHLVHSRVLNNGIVELWYEPTHARRKPIL